MYGLGFYYVVVSFFFVSIWENPKSMPPSSPNSLECVFCQLLSNSQILAGGLTVGQQFLLTVNCIISQLSHLVPHFLPETMQGEHLKSITPKKPRYFLALITVWLFIALNYLLCRNVLEFCSDHKQSDLLCPKSSVTCPYNRQKRKMHTRRKSCEDRIPSG